MTTKTYHINSKDIVKNHIAIIIIFFSGKNIFQIHVKYMF